VGSEYADPLERAGVDTVLELAQRNPGNLYQKLVDMKAINAEITDSFSLKNCA